MCIFPTKIKTIRKQVWNWLKLTDSNSLGVIYAEETLTRWEKMSDKLTEFSMFAKNVEYVRPVTELFYLFFYPQIATSEFNSFFFVLSVIGVRTLIDFLFIGHKYSKVTVPWKRSERETRDEKKKEIENSEIVILPERWWLLHQHQPSAEC